MAVDFGLTPIRALSARNEVLNKEINSRKNKIDTLKTALQNASENFGENDQRTLNRQIQLNKAKAELNNIERTQQKREGSLRYGE
jgi:chromosome segregation ATPase